MRHIIEKIQDKPHHHKLMYFWVLTSISVVASFSIWLVSLNSLISDLAKSPEKETIKKTVTNLSDLANEIKDASSKTKASFYEASGELIKKNNQDRIDEIKNQKEPDTRIPNLLPITR